MKKTSSESGWHPHTLTQSHTQILTQNHGFISSLTLSLSLSLRADRENEINRYILPNTLCISFLLLHAYAVSISLPIVIARYLCSKHYVSFVFFVFQLNSLFHLQPLPSSLIFLLSITICTHSFYLFKHVLVHPLPAVLLYLFQNIFVRLSLCLSFSAFTDPPFQDFKLSHTDSLSNFSITDDELTHTPVRVHPQTYSFLTINIKRLVATKKSVWRE